MTGNIALDVVVGLVFIYALYSLITTTIVEMIANLLSQRAIVLEKAIKRMLDDDNFSVFADRFYSQPLIKYLSAKKRKVFFKRLSGKSSYLQASNFSKAVISMLEEVFIKDRIKKLDADPVTDETGRKQKLDEIENLDPMIKIKEALALVNDMIETDQNQTPDTITFLKSLLRETQGDIEKFKAGLEEWFDTTMERVTGWYKKRIAFITFFVGLTLAVLLNIDTLDIARQLSKDPRMREQFVQLASAMVKDSLMRSDSASFTKLKQRLDTMYIMSSNTQSILSSSRMNNPALIRIKTQICAGWNWKKDSLNCIQQCITTIVALFTSSVFYKSLPGCLLTAIAISLGAPFWFDLLNKLVQLRGSVLPPTDSKTAPDSGGKNTQKSRRREDEEAEVNK
jgi:hypothetical protein